MSDARDAASTEYWLIGLCVVSGIAVIVGIALCINRCKENPLGEPLVPRQERSIPAANRIGIRPRRPSAPPSRPRPRPSAPPLPIRSRTKDVSKDASVGPFAEALGSDSGGAGSISSKESGDRDDRETIIENIRKEMEEEDSKWNKIIPKSFICPISLELISDPVTLDGRYFERSQIEGCTSVVLI